MPTFISPESIRVDKPIEVNFQLLQHSKRLMKFICNTNYGTIKNPVNVTGLPDIAFKLHNMTKNKNIILLNNKKFSVKDSKAEYYSFVFIDHQEPGDRVILSCKYKGYEFIPLHFII